MSAIGSILTRFRRPVGTGSVMIWKRGGYFVGTRAPQRSQRWKSSVRKNRRDLGTLCPNTLQRHFIIAVYVFPGPTCTSIFPMFSPASRPMKAAGAFSIPSTTVSR